MMRRHFILNFFHSLMMRDMKIEDTFLEFASCFNFFCLVGYILEYDTFTVFYYEKEQKSGISDFVIPIMEHPPSRGSASAKLGSPKSENKQILKMHCFQLHHFSALYLLCSICSINLFYLR